MSHSYSILRRVDRSEIYRCKLEEIKVIDEFRKTFTIELTSVYRIRKQFSIYIKSFSHRYYLKENLQIIPSSPTNLTQLTKILNALLRRQRKLNYPTDEIL